MKKKKTNPYMYKGDTLSACPVCKKVIQARVIEKQNKLYFEKFCSEHGKSSALISSDADWSRWSEGYNKPGEVPLKIGKKTEKSCPNDCGLCESHEQHSCFVQIEITDKCDLKCPNCYMGPENSWFLPKERAAQMFDRIVEMEGSPEVITLTGGEPTLHPDLFEIAEMAIARNIKYVLINTNGNKIAREPDFAKKLADAGLHVYLQFDGFKKENYLKIRGKDLLESKLRALENLEKANCPTVLSPVIEKYVNDDQVGEIIKLAVSKKFIKGVNFLPITYLHNLSVESGKWESSADACPDPMDRMTHADMVNAIEKYSDGLLVKSDFIPIPCHMPSCGSVTYLINNEDGAVPISKIINVDIFLDYVKNKPRVDMDDLFQVSRMELEKIWSMSAVGGTDKVMDSLRNLLTNCCAADPGIAEVFEDNVTQVSIHAFMDAHNWDIERARKCCIHFMLPNGDLMPFCQYNIFHRDKYRAIGKDKDINETELFVPEIYKD
ncbi:MAG: radical SAM protein [Bacteroidales bacterium]|nr:radical SAM protein [Bacteroidales bacterium]